MHICFATLDYPVKGSGGGVATVTRLLAQGMAARGHQVSVVRLGSKPQVAYADGPVQVHTFTQGSLHYYAGKMPLLGKHLALALRELERSYGLAKKLKALHQQKPIDLIEFSEEAVFFSAFSPLRNQCTYVARLHGTEYAWIPKVPGKRLTPALKMQRVLQRFFLQRCPHLIAVSQFYKDDLRSDLGEKAWQRIKVQPNPVEDTLKPKTEPLAADQKNLKPSFLFCNRIQDMKGIDLLIKALGQLRTTQPKFELLIAGNYHPSIPQAKFEQWLQEAQIKEQTKILGHLSKKELRTLMQKSTAVVVPSYFETFGLVAIEALQAGAAIIHTRVGIMAEAPSMKNVQHIETHDLKSLVNSLARAVQNHAGDTKGQKKGQEIRAFLERFGLEKHLNYFELLNKTGQIRFVNAHTS
jgi:glycosyltransferase involved in cell wall biosynthesis